MGYDEVIIETVGVGQNETSISRLAQTSMLVLSPGTGDSIQAIKSGIIEVADVIAVNKSDLDGAKEAAHQLKQNIVADRRGWRPPVLTVGALAGQGIDELWQAVEAHREFCAAHHVVDGHPEGSAATEDRAVALAVREVIGTASDPGVRADLDARGNDEERARRLLQLALERALGTTT